QAKAIGEQIARGDAQDAEIGKLRAALLDTESDLANRHEIESDLSRAQHVLDLLRNEMEHKQAELTEALIAARASLREATATNEETAADRDRWIRDYEVVVNSSSWKLTIPWRKLGGYVRGR